MRALKSIVKAALNYWPEQQLRREYEQQAFVKFNERPIEFRFAFQTLTQFYPKKILDVGTGTTAFPHLMRNCGFLVTAMDNIADYWPRGMFNRHYHVVNDDITNSTISESFDLITCISTLEHIVEFDAAVDNMFQLLNSGGFLLITCPYNESSYNSNVYDLPNSAYGQDAPYVTQSFSRREVTDWCRRNRAVIRKQEYWRFWDGEYWTVGERVLPPIEVSADEKHQLSCMLFQKNGDEKIFGR